MITTSPRRRSACSTVTSARTGSGCGGALDELIGPGRTFTLPPTAIHRVLHAATGPAVTIHAYSPPLTRMGAYSVGPGGELERISQSYADELRAEAAPA